MKRIATIFATFFLLPLTALANDEEPTLTLCVDGDCAGPLPACGDEADSVIDDLTAALDLDPRKKPLRNCYLWCPYGSTGPCWERCLGESPPICSGYGPGCTGGDGPYTPKPCCGECIVEPDDFWFEGILNLCDVVEEDGVLVATCN